ncbi:MAG: single-stranded-DNA-specific exonuclease RecJ [Proteobacteria bacterium]|nr:MAG: single-stranded-DNA-specific exonuclease RecJ [Pseudomonadota bacterium]
MKEKELHPAIEEHLKRQGIYGYKKREAFLHPTLKDLPSPFLMKDMGKGVELILSAFREKAQIIIWGDYDVDGISATSLLFLFFKELGYPVSCFIPNRLDEGYGLNCDSLEKLAQESPAKKLIITVDCGISNHDEILFAKKAGFDVIVTDHHTPPEKPVPADAIINPRQTDCPFPFKWLAGVGVAFYLCIAIRNMVFSNNNGKTIFNKPNLKLFMPFVAIGTIADVMPLTETNRVLVKAGFEILSSDQCQAGLKALFEYSGLSRSTIISENIAFQVAPAINAAGRLGQPEIALRTFTANKDGADSCAEKLISLNKKRKKICACDLEKALGIVSNNLPECNDSIIICDRFHDGLLGITAARLVDLYHVPAIVFSSDQKGTGQLKGSARAPAGFDLYRALSHCSRFIKTYGGHKAAAGLSVKAEYFEHFKACFNETAIQYQDTIESVSVNPATDCIELAVSEALDPVLLKNLVQLEPLGEANPKPLFYDPSAQFVSLSFFGSERKHVRGILRGTYRNIPFIGFSVGDKLNKALTGKTFGLIYSHLHDSYRFSSSWKLKIVNVWQ